MAEKKSDRPASPEIELTPTLRAPSEVGATGSPDVVGGCDHTVPATPLPTGETDSSLAQSDHTLPAGGQASDDFRDFRTVDRGEYRVVGELARGGMGRILNARDRRHGRLVAIKELVVGNAALEARFRREALLTARLQHPAIVPLYEAGRWPSGEPFYTMKKVVGKPLDKVIAEKKTLQERLSLLPNLMAVADAIAYAHEERIIHRDLKPANILVGDFGETVIIDWGLAKDLSVDSLKRRSCEQGGTAGAAPGAGGAAATAATLQAGEEDDYAFRSPRSPGSADDQLTVAGQAMGTPAYMPPEQARGEQVDTRADIYAIGAILYHLIAGYPPYFDMLPKNARVTDLLDQVIRGAPTPLSSVRNHVHSDLLAILEGAMARNVEKRYQTARNLAEELKRFTAGRLVQARDYSKLEVAFRWAVLHIKLPAVAALLVTIGIVVAGLFAIRRLVSEGYKAESVDRAAIQGRKSRTRDRVLLSIATGFSETDPTRSVAILREVEAPKETRGWFDAASRLTREPIAASVIGGPDNRVLAASLGKDGVRVASVSSSRLPSVSGASNWGKSVPLHDGLFAYHTVAALFSPDGMQLVTMLEGSTALLWRSDFTGPPVSVNGWGSKTNSWAFDQASRRLIAFSSEESKARISNADGSGEATYLIGHEGGLLSAAFNSDGRRVVTTSTDRTARIWRSDGKADEVVLRGHSRDVVHAAFNPDGRLVVTASLDGTARIWRSAGGRKSVVLKGHEKPVLWAAFSPDGRRVVTASADGTARIWKTAGGSKSVALRGHGKAVRSAAFSPDGERVLTASDDGTARLWRTDGSGVPVIFRCHRGGVASATFDPQGTRIMTLSKEGRLLIWSALPAKFPSKSPIDAKRLRDWMWRATDLCLQPGERQEILGDEMETAEERFQQCRSRVQSVTSRWTGPQHPKAGGE